jgi:hypothetical protein
VTARGGWREGALATLGFAALTAAFTFPLAFRLGSIARADNGDGQFSIWNVAWVARALVLDPLHVFDANIFYPHKQTLAYSESNLGAGALAAPVYWATKNPYAAHNFVLLLSFVCSGVAMYFFMRHLVQDRRAAAVSGIVFAFCPYLSAHLPHMQLLWTAGLPLAALMCHRLAAKPTAGRAAALGAVIALQAYFCGYYAVFVALITALSTLTLAWARGQGTSVRYWSAVAGAAAVGIVAALPVLVPYFTHQQATGFARSLDAARQFSADWRAFVTSPSYAHGWLATAFGALRGEPCFPGFTALAFGGIGMLSGWRSGGRLREAAALYGAIGILAVWAAFGPSGRLYSVFYAVIPVFSFLRAPSRFGLVSDFALSILAGIGVASVLARARRPNVAGFVIAAVAFAELLMPVGFPRVPPADEGYRVLAGLPAGPVLELPVYSRRFAFARELYMLNSTIHWMPLIDAYSDYIPPDFLANADAMSTFPSREAFAVLEPMQARYAVFHPATYDEAARAALAERLKAFAPYLRPHYLGDRLLVYEITGFPR